jgi:hypothetical protein
LILWPRELKLPSEATLTWTSSAGSAITGEKAK